MTMTDMQVLQSLFYIYFFVGFIIGVVFVLAYNFSNRLKQGQKDDSH